MREIEKMMSLQKPSNDELLPTEQPHKLLRKTLRKPRGKTMLIEQIRHAIKILEEQDEESEGNRKMTRDPPTDSA